MQKRPDMHRRSFLDSIPRAAHAQAIMGMAEASSTTRRSLTWVQGAFRISLVARWLGKDGWARGRAAGLPEKWEKEKWKCGARVQDMAEGRAARCYWNALERVGAGGTRWSWVGWRARIPRK